MFAAVGGAIGSKGWVGSTSPSMTGPSVRVRVNPPHGHTQMPHLGPQQVGRRHGDERVDGGRARAFGDVGRAHPCVHPFDRPHAGTALDDRPVEQAGRRGGGEERADLCSTTRLTEDRDALGIPAEADDVVADPPEACHQVEQAGIGGADVALAPQLGEIQVTQGAEPVVHRHDDDVAPPGEVFAGGERPLARPERPVPAVEPDHHRPAGVAGSGRPHIEPEAVFVLDLAVAAGDVDLVISRTRHRLRARRAELERVLDSQPRGRRARWLEPVAAPGRRPVGDALEHHNTGRVRPPHPPGRRLDDRSARGHVNERGPRARVTRPAPLGSLRPPARRRALRCRRHTW